MAGLRIPVDTTEARRNLANLSRGFKSVGAQSLTAQKQVGGFKGVLGRAQTGFKSLTSNIFGLKGAIAGLIGVAALGGLSRSFLNAARTSSGFQVRLKILLGSAEAGQEVFRRMSEYAGKVPFEFENVMAAATNLSGVMKGGVDEVSQWIPLVGDLAAATGISIEETTGQVIRMYSAGAASADLFRERGVLAMLGFQAGVTYSADETRKRLMEAWEDPASKFAGATDAIAKTWGGMMSMLADKWFQFRNMVMGAGVFDYLKAVLSEIVGQIDDLASSGKLQEWAQTAANYTIKAFNAIIKGAALVADAFNGWQMIWNGLKETWHLVSFAVLKGIGMLYNALAEFMNKFRGFTQEIGNVLVGLGKTFNNQDWINAGQLYANIDNAIEGYKVLGTEINAMAEKEYDKLDAIVKQNEALASQETYYKRASEFTDKIMRKVKAAQNTTIKPFVAPTLTPESGPSKEDLKTRKQFDEDYDKTTMERYDYEIKKLDELKTKYAEAGVEKVRLDEWYAARHKQILEDIEKDNNKLGEAAKQTFMSGAGNAFESFISGTQSAKEAFSNFATQFTVDIGKMIAKQLLLNALQSAMGAAGGSGGGWAGGLMALGSSIFKADGGSFFAGRNYIVGERGPEKFVSDRGDSAVVGANGPEAFSPRSKGRIDPNGGGEAPKITIANIMDPAMVNDWANSAEGQDAIMNVISTNKDRIF